MDRFRVISYDTARTDGLVPHPNVDAVFSAEKTRTP
jgi:hypothetical protein